MKMPFSMRLFMLKRRVLRKLETLKEFTRTKYFIIAITVVLLLASLLTFGLVYVDYDTGTIPNITTDNNVPSEESTTPTMNEPAGPEGPVDAQALQESETDNSPAFPDSKLEDAVRAALGKPENAEILETDLQELTCLDIGKSGITDLSGIGYCSNLDTLTAWDNDIADLSPLSGLQNLACLFLGNNRISDLSPLSDLDNLTELYIWHNQIQELSPISGLTGLTILDISFNEISDFTPLSSLPNLSWIYIEGNYISENLSLSFLSDSIEIYPGTRQDPNLNKLINEFDS